jgi:predicted alpha/beta superfamily hydrolase
MKVKFAIILTALFFFSYKAEKKDTQNIAANSVTMIVNELPSDHDYTKDIYISGDFEGWSGGKLEFKLERNKKTYSITLPKQQEIISYKFTLGSWDSVETSKNGDPIENRIYTFSDASETIRIAIGNWASLKKVDAVSTVQKNVRFIENFEMLQLNRKRRIAVYLPPNYTNSGKFYPVLYMHDGQNVFDKATSYAGEWEVDETLNKIYKESGLEIIVVAIDNSENRMQEYTAWEHKEYGKPEGKAYIDFIVHTLKPTIDTELRTKKDAFHTGIMGSSMGGLISHYAALQYPEVFGRVGVFSPSFWFSENIIPFTRYKSAEAKKSKFYFLMGEKEGNSMITNFQKVTNAMKTTNFPNENMLVKLAPNGAHSEAFWRSEFEEAVIWLFKDPQMVENTQKIEVKEVTSVKLAAGKLMRVQNFPSSYVALRNVDIWLPENYNTEKKYSVLYMHDGQNLFDATTTWNKQEWKVDEVASQLMKEEKAQDFIVVAIHNIPKIRYSDYYPKKTLNYLSEKTLDSVKTATKKINPKFDFADFNADNYLKFIVYEVKPFVDANFSVKTDRAHTFVAGSSMGGLISMYAACEYPNVFGSAACISTHWIGAMPTTGYNPFPRSFFAYMNENLPSSKTHKFYFDYGTKTLDQYYPQYAETVNAIFKKKGYTDTNYKNLLFEGADHSETSWQKRLHIPFTFLLKKAHNGH